MECICLNDTYSQETLAVFAKNKVRYPKKQEICTITRTHKYVLQGNKIGVFILGYEGQFIEDPKTKQTNEISFSSNRFSRLDGSELDMKELKSIKNLV